MNKFAVIDIGSNSVRLVVYESLRRAPYVIFNEKILCGLGGGLGTEMLMQSEPMDRALESLRRFRLMLDKMDVKDCRVVATSAVREAKNGPDFVERIRKEAGLEVSVIPGEEEARLSGLGVLCALPRANGIMGDLGGGSLELARLRDDGVTDKVSFAIGPLKYLSLEGRTIASPRKDIDAAIASLDWASAHTDENFYAVGGAWRAIAKIHIMENNYALKNVHHYIMTREEALKLTDRLSKMHSVELGRYRMQISSRRLRVLPLAAYILNRLLKKLKAKRLVTSGYGLREGLLYEAMGPGEQARDPLIEACIEMAVTTGRFSEHGQRIQKWIDPLFPDDNPEQKRLRFAAAILSDVGWRGHPEYRAEKALDEVMHGRLLGNTHRGAAFIGLALFICYGGRSGGLGTKDAESLLRPEDVRYANQVGLALRLAQRISGGTEKGLKSAALEVKGQCLRLKVQKKDEALINEVVVKRFSRVAKEFDLDEDVSII
ncbi:Ppx/GppA family phosphatase [Paremcibacter congregatus]|uniref:Ppx/GppA family phosphatase n=1 Tax=Paremcibacter congregatus TaxID=2043170 RepID=UPI0030EB67DF